MKILQLIQKQQFRGAEIFASQLSEHMVSYGHEVILVSLFGGNAELPFSGKKFTIGAALKNRFADFRAWKNLNDLILEFDPDIVQANAGDTLKYAVFSRLFFRWRAKIVFRNANLMSAFFRGALHKSLNGWFLDKCDYFVSVSENCRKDLMQLSNKAKERSITIPIGTENFSSIVPVPREVPDNEPIFLNVASHVQEKNQAFLIETFHQYYLKYRHGYLWLVGDGVLNSSLKEKTNLLGLDERVRFWGYQKDVIAILKASDVFILPSIIEGIPGAILESLSCNIPVIVSNAGGIPEVIEDGFNGFCLRGYKSEEYIHCMHTLATDPPLRAKFSSAGSKTIQSTYLMPQISKRFCEWYINIVLIDK